VRLAEALVAVVMPSAIAARLESGEERSPAPARQRPPAIAAQDQEMATTFLSCAGAIWWCLAVALLLLTLCCGLVQPIVQERRATAAARPPVSVILPIKSLIPDS